MCVVEIQGESVVVDAVMAVSAHEGEFVDVGFALGGGVPWREVMGFTGGMIEVAQDTAAIADHQREPLAAGDHSLRPAMPEDFTDIGHEMRCMVGNTSVVLGDGDR